MLNKYLATSIQTGICFLLQPTYLFQPKSNSLPSQVPRSGGLFGVSSQAVLLPHLGNARETIPCFGFRLITLEPAHLVGTYVIELCCFVRALLFTRPRFGVTTMTACRSYDITQYFAVVCVYHNSSFRNILLVYRPPRIS